MIGRERNVGGKLRWVMRMSRLMARRESPRILPPVDIVVGCGFVLHREDRAVRSRHQRCRCQTLRPSLKRGASVGCRARPGAPRRSIARRPHHDQRIVRFCRPAIHLRSSRTRNASSARRRSFGSSPQGCRCYRTWQDQRPQGPRRLADIQFGLWRYAKSLGSDPVAWRIIGRRSGRAFCKYVVVGTCQRHRGLDPSTRELLWRVRP